MWLFLWVNDAFIFLNASYNYNGKLRFRAVLTANASSAAVSVEISPQANFVPGFWTPCLT